jgi:hypothetical protein
LAETILVDACEVPGKMEATSGDYRNPSSLLLNFDLQTGKNLTICQQDVFSTGL